MRQGKGRKEQLLIGPGEGQALKEEMQRRLQYGHYPVQQVAEVGLDKVLVQDR